MARARRATGKRWRSTRWRSAIPEATWTLRRRARLSLAGGLALTGFELHADGQRVAIDLRADDRERTAHVVVSRLDLGRLPRALVSPAMGLGGVVDASVDVRAQSGAGARPRVVATAKLAGGRIRGHRDLSLDLQARMERGRASGAFNARAPGIAATARFDLPGEWPPRNAARADRSRRRRHRRRPGGRREDAGRCPGREGRPCGGAGAGVDQGRGPRRASRACTSMCRVEAWRSGIAASAISPCP